LVRGEVNNKSFRKGKGCPKCFDTGYLGREAIIELLEVDDSIRQIIYDGSMTQLTRYLYNSDFQSFREAAIAKISSGTTTISEVLRVLPHSALAKRNLNKDIPSNITMLNAS
jgi:type II secretory ATPase GspE/PulE/Tfp pilus assembly ATPase PilB-like protein